MRVELSGPTDVGNFRSQVNNLLAHQVQPGDIAWDAQDAPATSVPFRSSAAPGPQAPSALHSIVPRSFARLTELVLLHRDPARFDLLYRLLWRMVHEPELTGSRGDPDMDLARSMAQAVRRDIQRARKAVYLRSLAPQAGEALSIGWCAPQHQVTELVAQWLSTLVPTPPWLLVSPDRCVLWTGRHLLCGAGMSAPQATTMSVADWHALAARLASRT